MSQYRSMMSRGMANTEIAEAAAAAANAPASEHAVHRSLLLRHSEALAKALLADGATTHRQLPVGCPTATDVVLGKKRTTDNEKYDCALATIDATSGQFAHSNQDGSCHCGDPLSGHGDPLNGVAATVLAGSCDGCLPRYFQHEYRRRITTLTADRTWGEIAEWTPIELKQYLDERTDSGVAVQRAQQLLDALDILSEHRYTDGVSLTDLPTTSYDHLVAFLTELPNIDEHDAWWLLLTAFDKPVWPTDPALTDGAVALGLLAPSARDSDQAHRPRIETDVTDRLLLPLHRGLATVIQMRGSDMSGLATEVRKFFLSYRVQQQTRSVEAANKSVIIDLFAGAGGLSLGFENTGFQVALAVDHNEAATDTYRLNHPEVPHERVLTTDIEEAVCSDVFSGIAASSDVDVVVGGPPCQALSIAGYRSRRANDDNYSVADDYRTTLYEQYIAAIQRLDPEFIVMENVMGIVNRLEGTDHRIIEDVIAGLDDAGYHADYRELDCSEYGIPQKRDRVIVIGRRKVDSSVPEEDVADVFNRLDNYRTDDPPTLRDALSGLVQIRRGRGGPVTIGRTSGRRSDFVTDHELGSDTSLVFNHQARRHPKPKDRELFETAMSPGDTSWDIVHSTEYDHLVDYDVGTEDEPRFSDKYRMLRWDDPAPTVVAHLAKDSNNFIIPDYYDHVSANSEKEDPRRNRGVTPREAARIQTFPDEYVFLGAFTSWFRQIGNAVPPLLGHHVATAVADSLATGISDSAEAVSSSVQSAVADDD